MQKGIDGYVMKEGIDGWPLLRCYNKWKMFYKRCFMKDVLLKMFSKKGMNEWYLQRKKGMHKWCFERKKSMKSASKKESFISYIVILFYENISMRHMFIRFTMHHMKVMIYMRYALTFKDQRCIVYAVCVYALVQGMMLAQPKPLFGWPLLFHPFRYRSTDKRASGGFG